jgi:hypothetical protein
MERRLQKNKLKMEIYQLLGEVLNRLDFITNIM